VSDFNPFAERSRPGDVIVVDKETVGLMRAAFMGMRRAGRKERGDDPDT
jgi:hypothetical protein